MDEWQKILLTSLLSFSVGALLEPLKSSIRIFLDAKHERRALYIELGQFYHFVHGCMEETPGTPIFKTLFGAVAEFEFPVYRHVKSKHDVFYSLREAELFDNLVRLVKYASEVMKPENFLRKLVDELDSCLKAGTLDEHLFCEVSYEEYEVHRKRIAKRPTKDTTKAEIGVS